ncbi:MAG: nucleotidyltransferase domain-containing protein [Candidatus Omnitrophica bacterium]|jgi:predicted nucleotidyltransferase|nr:nucleotidyltransferase domain-containing protein [Candidatus Omnitrophota bacterium]
MKNIFSTEERIKILRSIVFRTGPISVNATAINLKLSKGLISIYFNILVKEGILKRSKNKFIMLDSPLVKGIKILLNIESFPSKIFRKFPFVVSAGLYGSSIKGENIEDSDTDIWIKVKDVEEGKLASLSSQLNKKIKHAKILFLTEKKIKELQKEDEMFYHSLTFGSIIIYGEKNGIQI